MPPRAPASGQRDAESVGVIGTGDAPAREEIGGPRLSRLVQLERALDANQQTGVAGAQLPARSHADRIFKHIGEQVEFNSGNHTLIVGTAASPMILSPLMLWGGVKG
jgi:hypothetical protein